MFGKLKSEEGATLVAGLLFFVVCAAMGAVVLTAATTTAGRIKTLQEIDRTDYVLASATDLLRETLLDEEMTAFFPGGRIGEMTPETSHGVFANDMKSTVAAMAFHTYDEKLFEPLMAAIEASPEKNRFTITKRMTDSADDDPPLTSGSEESAKVFMTLEDGFSAEDEKLPPVNIVLTMYDNFDLTAELSIKTDDEKDAGRTERMRFCANDVEVTLSKTLADADAEERSAVLNSFEVRWPVCEAV